MPQLTEKSFFNIMSCRRKLQQLKALVRAPQGTLAFRSYLLMVYRTILCDKTFGDIELLKERKRLKVEVV